MDAAEIERAVEQRRIWLDEQLVVAGSALDVQVIGEPVNTFDMRSADAFARGEGGDVWLRVVVQDADYEPACRWDSNVEANSIRGAAKPEVLRGHDWQHDDAYLRGRRLGGEVITLASGGVLHEDPSCRKLG